MNFHSAAPEIKLSDDISRTRSPSKGKWSEFAEAISDYTNRRHSEKVSSAELLKVESDSYYLPEMFREIAMADKEKDFHWYLVTSKDGQI